MNYALFVCIAHIHGFLGQCKELVHSFGFLWAELDK